MSIVYHSIQPKFSRIGVFTHVDNVHNIRKSLVREKNSEDMDTVFHSSGKVTFDLNNREYRYSEEQMKKPF